jgi:hypothetical protein
MASRAEKRSAWLKRLLPSRRSPVPVIVARYGGPDPFPTPAVAGHGTGTGDVHRARRALGPRIPLWRRCVEGFRHYSSSDSMAARKDNKTRASWLIRAWEIGNHYLGRSYWSTSYAVKRDPIIAHSPQPHNGKLLNPAAQSVISRFSQLLGVLLRRVDGSPGSGTVDGSPGHPGLKFGSGVRPARRGPKGPITVPSALPVSCQGRRR